MADILNEIFSVFNAVLVVLIFLSAGVNAEVVRLE